MEERQEILDKIEETDKEPTEEEKKRKTYKKRRNIYFFNFHSWFRPI